MRRVTHPLASRRPVRTRLWCRRPVAGVGLGREPDTPPEVAMMQRAARRAGEDLIIISGAREVIQVMTDGQDDHSAAPLARGRRRTGGVGLPVAS
jgi:hypothetical protein